MTVQQFLYKKDIETTIKRLNAKDLATKKMKKLGPNQTEQISYIHDNQLLQDHHPQFEWIVAQLERNFYPADKNGKKLTRSITVYLKRRQRITSIACHRPASHNAGASALGEPTHGATAAAVSGTTAASMRMQQNQQKHAELKNISRMMGFGGRGGQGPRRPFGSGMPRGVGGRGRGDSLAGIRIVEMSDSDGKSSSRNSDTNSDSGRLAFTYQNQERWKEAEDLEMQVIICQGGRLDGSINILWPAWPASLDIPGSEA